MSTMSTPRAVTRPVALPISKAMLWLVGTSMMIHEFVHDSRHFLGFPCH
jgi:cobalt transporter subunit CbtB